MKKIRHLSTEPYWAHRPEQLLAVLMVGVSLVVAAAFFGAVYSWLFNGIRIARAASTAQASPPSGKQVEKVAPPVAANSDNQSRFDAERKELEARIDAEQKAADAKVNEELEGAKALLEALIGLTGLATLIIGFLTYMSVKYARDEAKDQVEILRKKIEEIENTFPEFSGLDDRIRRRLREVEALLPSEANWNDVESFANLHEEEKQEILDNEIAISASVSVFALDRSPIMRARLVSIYSAFARFYLARYKTSSGSSESDYVRAVSYATRAIDLAPEAAEGYRLRGAIYLARYEHREKAAPPDDEGKLKQLLDSAEADLKFAASKRDPVDAGAFYDLALLEYYRNDTEGAVRTSRDLIDNLKGKISAMHREKYLPSTYRNLVCYLAKLAKGAVSEEKKQELSREAVAALKAGIEEFKITKERDRGLAELAELKELKKGIEQDLKDDENLRSLGPPFKEQIEELLKPAPPAKPAMAESP